MKRARVSCLVVCGALVLAQGAFGQDDTFTLGFSGSDTLAGSAGAVASGNYLCTLTHDAPNEEIGAQGWSLSMTADNAVITAITTAGTDTAALFSGGFEQTEITTPEGSIDDCAGKAGAVSAIILSFGQPIKLPINATSTLAAITVEATIPEGEDVATLSYVNRCAGTGQPVPNNITQEGNSRVPVLVPHEIRLLETPCVCPAELAVGFSSTAQVGAPAWSGVVGIDGPTDCSDVEAEDCLAGDGTIVMEGSPGEVVSLDFFTSVVQQIPDGNPRVQGWSVSIAVDGDLVVTGATSEGTAGGPAPGGLQMGGFEVTEIVDPDDPVNSGQAGAVSAIILSFGSPVVLPNGTTSILAITVEGTVPDVDPGSGGGSSVVGGARFQAGLKGSGQAVPNVLTVSGNSAAVANFDFAGVTFDAQVVLARNFIRGNANDDAKVNIADPVYTINALFRGGPEITCLDAADANDDGMVDLSDAQYAISYLFLSGPAPLAPFPDCGQDPSDAEGDGDGLSCEADQGACAGA